MVIVDLHFNVDDVVPVGSVVLADHPELGLIIYFGGESFEVIRVLAAQPTSSSAGLARLVVVVVKVEPA